MTAAGLVLKKAADLALMSAAGLALMKAAGLAFVMDGSLVVIKVDCLVPCLAEYSASPKAASWVEWMAAYLA